MKNLSRSTLVKWMDYDPSSGLFIRKIDAHKGRWKAGSVAGCQRPDGYVNIYIEGTLYLAHNLAWLFVHGEYPTRKVDHKNRVRSDNRIENLRKATPMMNMGNMKMNVRNTSGFRGVVWHKKDGVWIAQIGRRYIGSYKTKEEAAVAYDSEAIKKFGEFATTNFTPPSPIRRV